MPEPIGNEADISFLFNAVTTYRCALTSDCARIPDLVGNTTLSHRFYSSYGCSYQLTPVVVHRSDRCQVKSKHTISLILWYLSNLPIDSGRPVRPADGD